MKLKKIILLTISVFVLASTMNLFNKVQAATEGKYLNITMLRKSGYGYQLAKSRKNVWKIYEEGTNKDDTIYCLRGGPGFSSEDMAIAKPTKTLYSKFFDMRKPETITENFLAAIPDTNSKNYEQLMWVLDNCYVPAKENASTEEIETANINRKILIDAAKKYVVDEGFQNVDEMDFDFLTDDDIDAVQQLAVWHFTNPTKDGKYPEYHVEKFFEFYLNAVKDNDGNYKALSDKGLFENGIERMNACQGLFQYLVETPKKLGFSYDYKKQGIEKNPIEIVKTKVSVKKDKGRKIVGPYKINKVNNVNYDAEAKWLDNNNNVITDVKYLDENQKELHKTTLKDLEGKEFYITIPENTDTSKIEFEISGAYIITTIEYWSVENPGGKDQPVVIIKKVRKLFKDSLIYNEERQFDLALRKYITKINGVELTKQNSRIPKIDESTLKAGTTARYKHRKDPVLVTVGDKVTYSITIYNEGSKAGRTTKIVDQLPTGLKFLKVVSGNFELDTYNEATDNTLKLKRKESNTTNLPAYVANKLSSETIELECEVTTNASDKKILTNVAWIAEEIDENGTVITNQKAQDRDSEPYTKPNVDKDNMENYAGDDNKLDLSDENNYYRGQQDDDDFEKLIIKNKEFDLALRKFIVKINGIAPSESREPLVDVTPLKNGTATTAIYKHPKYPLEIKTGDKVIYTIRIYNEGEIDGYATEVTDYLPKGLKFVEDSQINNKYGWINPSGDGKTIKTNYLQDKLIPAFDGTNLKFEDLQVECEVIEKVEEQNKRLKNIAEITKHKDKDDNQNVIDRDSQPDNVDKNNYEDKSQQDDDDFEDLILKGKQFDLALRKFITTVEDGKENVKKYDREPKVDVTNLKNGTATTAIYKHSKTPVGVSTGDIVTYIIRVYNEGEIDGYVTEITDHLPQQLEFLANDELNAKYAWKLSTDGRTIKTDITSPNTASSANRDIIYKDRNKENSNNIILKAFNGTELDYIDVKVRCKVKENINLFEKITNIADITEFKDSEGNVIKDKDSQENNVKIPQDDELPKYKDSEIESKEEYIPGQQDDDDFEKLEVKRFDLALRKFITGVISGEKQTNITNRVPVFKRTEDGKYIYEHTKEPVEVANGNTVVYTLRIYNEGNISGYAQEIKDNIPNGLEFLPENVVNLAYRWKMYKEDGTETKDVKEAKVIKTDYLSKEQDLQGDKLLKAFDSKTMKEPDHKDIKVAFKVTEPNTSDRIIINIAEITDDADENGDPIEDNDSIPNNDKPEEDDIDIEKIKVKYFDLSLKKWVTEAIIKYKGKTEIIKTGHTGDENPEPPAKVEIKDRKIKDTTVKFKFKIKVTNEGEIAGYVKEIIDYIPEGLKFLQEDNPKWREENGKVLTNQLKDKLLQPGESETVEIILTWINNKNNLGEKVNWAEIYEDYNEEQSPDIDSIPGNNKIPEDDIDSAPVILSVITGSTKTYMALTIISISIIATGVILIKKFII